MSLELDRGGAGTFKAMGRGRAWQGLLVSGALGLLAGCGGKTASVTTPVADAAKFSVCAGTPAVPYAPGLAVLSASGLLRASLASASTDQAGPSPIPTAAIGYDTFTIAVTTVVDGGPGADAGAPAPDGLTMTEPPLSANGIPADPWMPIHKHGGSTVPAISAVGGGRFTVANLDFFMAGYWQLYLDLTPAGGGTPDLVTFDLCIPDD